ncbi:MAG: NAD(P)H-binding protein [Bacteroidota bacterium]
MQHRNSDMIPTRNALILGASGVTGACLLKRLLEAGMYKSIYAAVRRPLSVGHSSLQEFPIDGTFPDREAMAGADVFCCLGTTMAKAGSKEAFRAVDYELPMRFAREAKAAGAKRFFLISAMGANPDSMVFYNRVKGELERDLAALGFESLGIFRPGLLLGERAEKRPGEQFAKRIFGAINRFLPTSWKGIASDRVAESMQRAAGAGWEGQRMFTNAAMIQGI